MRRLAPALALLLIAGCHKPSFDERYEEAEKQVRATAAGIDKELDEREQAMAGAAAPTAKPT